MADDIKSLIDQYGQPIPSWQIAQLRESIADTDAMQGRPPFQGHLSFGIEPERLGNIIRAADYGQTLEWMIVAEEIEELFPHYSSVLSKRKRQVSQLPITIVAAEDVADGEKHAVFVRQWLSTGVLARAMFDICDAVGKGYTANEIIWESKPGCVRPLEIKYRPQRFFEISPIDGETVWLRTEGGFADLAPHKFLLHTHRSKSGNVVRSALTRMVAWLWMHASYTLKDWALFVQGYGLPIRIGRYGPEAGADDKRVLWRAVQSIAGDVAAIIPKSMEIEFIKGAENAAGTDLYLKRADWLNREVSKLVLGGTAGTEAISGGHAVGQEHRAAEADIEKFDAGLLGNSITRQIIQTMIAFTFGPQDAYPTASVGRPEEVPLKDVIAAVGDLGPLGFKVKAQEIRDRLQLTKPEDGDETIGGVPPAPVDKPAVPHLAITPPEGMTMRPGALLGRLITLQSEAPPEVVEQLTERLAEDAAGALAGMTTEVRHCFEQATDMHDLAMRVSQLKLDPRAFADAMSRGLALAELVGQAALVDELRGRGND